MEKQTELIISTRTRTRTRDNLYSIEYRDYAFSIAICMNIATSVKGRKWANERWITRVIEYIYRQMNITIWSKCVYLDAKYRIRQTENKPEK